MVINGKGDHWSIKIQKKFKAHLCHTLDLYWELWTACLQSRLKQRYSYFGPIQANIIKYERFCLKAWKLRDSPFRKTDANCIIASEGFPLGCVLTKLIFSYRDQSFSLNIWKVKINFFTSGGSAERSETKSIVCQGQLISVQMICIMFLYKLRARLGVSRLIYVNVDSLKLFRRVPVHPS